MAQLVKCFVPNSKNGTLEFVGWIGGTQTIFEEAAIWSVVPDFAQAFEFEGPKAAQTAIKYLNDEQGESLLYKVVDI